MYLSATMSSIIVLALLGLKTVDLKLSILAKVEYVLQKHQLDLRNAIALAAALLV